MSRVLATTPLSQRQPLPRQLDPDRLPAHVAVIMDGNGRWARQRGLPRVMGHRAGVEALKRTLRLCSDWGIGALTAYAFSTENWSARSPISFRTKPSAKPRRCSKPSGQRSWND